LWITLLQESEVFMAKGGWIVKFDNKEGEKIEIGED